jgi:fatty-acyl-CoA synthase
MTQLAFVHDVNVYGVPISGVYCLFEIHLPLYCFDSVSYLVYGFSIASLFNINDLVHLKGSDGKAGMAAIQLEEGYVMSNEILKQLYEHVFKHLPHYARPIFIRVVTEFITTQTMKHRKLELVKEGFDPDFIKDPLFVLDHGSRSYEPLSSSKISTLLTSRL